MTTEASAKTSSIPKAILSGFLIFLGLFTFSAFFILLDNTYYQFTNARFPNVGTSTWLATLWGVVSRVHILIIIVPFVIWQPRRLGFQIGKIAQHWRLLLSMFVLNCGVIAAYLWLTNGTTPYSNDIWLLTEVVTVPLVEEIFWRGLVFTGLQFLFTRLYGNFAGKNLTIWVSGISFGLLHGNNLFAGVPLAFVTIQVLNATIWGVVYGYARSKTESVYPPIILHAAMNLVAILF